MPEIDVQDVPLDKLRVWERNPRRITKERFASLKKSMVEDPDMMRARPLIALMDGRVIAGNMRLLAAEELGWETIPTVYVDLDEAKAATWALRDNSPYGEWDDQLLAELIHELAELEIDLDLTGFTAADIANLPVFKLSEGDDDRGTALELADLSIGDPLHVVERGEIWKLGPHYLVCASVYDGWRLWLPLLQGERLFVPYPTPTLPLGARAKANSLVMVQPDRWLAGHVLDKFVAINGEDQIERA